MGNFLRATVLLVICTSLPAQVNVLTYHNDLGRTGQNLNEVLLNPANVNTNTFGKLFAYSVDGYVYAQPLYVSGMTIPGFGARNVVFVATEHNSVYALDADSNLGASGGVLWQVNLGPSAATPTQDFGERYGNYTDIVPEVGITSTPVIDLASGTIYVEAFTHEGSSYLHRLHALNITNGVEQPGSPVLVAASVPGAGVGGNGSTVTFSAQQQVQRAALTLSNGRLYVAYGGFADTNPFHGWVIGYNPATLAVLSGYVFNTTPNATLGGYGSDAGEAGLWMSGDGLAVNESGYLFLATGNGSFNALNTSGGTEYGCSVLKLATASGLSVADYFTPYDQGYLSSNDLDLGSGGVMLLPDQPGALPHLMVAGGKGSKVYLINRDMMTTGNNHYNNGGSSDAVLQTVSLGGGLNHTPAYFNGRVYWAAVGDVMASFAISGGTLGSLLTGPRTYPYPGATPSVSANGANNGIVWTLLRANPAILIASNPTNVSQEIYTSAQLARDQLAYGVKNAVPTIANGHVYAGGQYALAVFGLLGGPYKVWKWAHFGTNSNSNVIGNLADPDADGIPNVWEYALAGNPTQADPQNKLSGSLAANTFRLRFRRNLSATDLTWFVQEAADVRGSWNNLATYNAATGWTTNKPGISVSESAASGSPPDQSVTVSVYENIAASSGAAFYRILLGQ